MTTVAVNLTTLNPDASWTGTIGAGSTITLNPPIATVNAYKVFNFLYKSVPTTTTLPGTFTLVGTVTLKTVYVYDASYSNVDMVGDGQEYTGGTAVAI
ncbi:MAG: hypothetical protein JHC33_00490, partial [Ignisphaera sp.]|nr:hypothetical protein [Ignisphaera sp.]